MANILIASLGDSPMVVTAMVKALKEQKDIQPDKVIVLYPKKHSQIEDSINYIKKYSLCRDVEEFGLEFFDANTYERCFHFLQILYGFLEAYQNDTVYLSLAGGRKSMSALMSLLAPFYKNIVGLYHILDKNEGTKNANFFELEKLLDYYCLDDPKLETIMNPSSENLNLVEIPFGHFTDAEDLRKTFGNYNVQKPLKAVPIRLDKISTDILDFWTAIFQKTKPPVITELDVFLSHIAFEQYQLIGDNQRKVFDKYFRLMRSPKFLDEKKHGTFGGEGAIFHFCKLRRTGERPLFYRKDNRVTITQLTNKADNSYQELSNKLTNKNYVPSVNEYEPSCSINELTPFGDILIAALGKSPMVVTQAYTLFTNSNIKIQKVALVFPKLNGEIENAVRMLEEVFKLKKVDVLKCGVKLADVASKEDCQLFLQRMIGAIDEISVSYPESAIKLLLSGGRKGMTALSYFTAQRSNISDVYHTLITDPQIEKQIEEECSLKILQKLGSSQKKAEKMFLESYQKNNFVLFKIPVIPFIN